MVAKWTYPEVRQEELVETLHGHEVADPYRWMEDPDCAETKEFVESQNKITMPYLEKCTVREQFHSKLTELFNYPKQGCPSKKGDKFYFSRNSGLQNQSVMYVQDTPSSPPSVFLDPNTFSTDGTVSLGGTAFSKDGKLFAYTVSVSGSDWRTVKFRDCSSGDELSDVLEDVKFSCLSWTHDNKGLFYNRYPTVKGVDLGTETNSNVNQQLYYHTLGTPQSEDVLCYEHPSEPHWMTGAEVTECGKYVVLTVSKGCEPVNKLYVHTLQTEGVKGMLTVSKIIDNFEAEYEYIINKGSVLYFKTNKAADKYRLVAIDVDNPGEVKEVIAEAPSAVMEWISCVRHDLLVVCYMEHCVNVMQLHSFEGALLQKIPLSPGSIIGYSGRPEDNFAYFKFMSFVNPGIIYHLDLSTNDAVYESVIYWETPIQGFSSADFESKQVFYKSKDGTDVPMFVTHRKDLVMDGSAAAMLYGYGGFNISLTPSFSVSRMIFIKHLGGVYVSANMRGGGEYGNDWHHAGSLANKQNVFDDFCAAGEALCSLGYTNPEKLAIEGGSNGGLLVAACANQRPELFRAVVCHVGVLDMYRFHKFTIGHAWMTEFGDPGKPEEFEWLRAYSPLHNIPNVSKYPAMLLLTGDHDDRVVPLHSLKFIAALQHKLGPTLDTPLLIRIDTKSGHGGGKPTSKRLQEASECYSFVARELGLSWNN